MRTMLEARISMNGSYHVKLFYEEMTFFSGTIIKYYWKNLNKIQTDMKPFQLNQKLEKGFFIK